MIFRSDRLARRGHAGLVAGRPVAMTIDEPWEFASEHGTGPFVGEIVSAAAASETTERAVILLRLSRPLLYEGSACEYFVAAPRWFGDDLRNISPEQGVNCSFMRTSEHGARSKDPFDLAWWRSGSPLVGSLRAI
jgi:hypothetical protein